LDSPKEDVLEVSAKEGEWINELKEAIEKNALEMSENEVREPTKKKKLWLKEVNGLWSQFCEQRLNLRRWRFINDDIWISCGVRMVIISWKCQRISQFREPTKKKKLWLKEVNRSGSQFCEDQLTSQKLAIWLIKRDFLMLSAALGFGETIKFQLPFIWNDHIVHEGQFKVSVNSRSVWGHTHNQRPNSSNVTNIRKSWMPDSFSFSF
jgi:hypothetical protein